MTNLSSVAPAGIEPSFMPGPILIFSKDPDTRFLLRTLLGILSYPTIEADVAEDCARVIDDASPGLLLMDVVYPLQDDLTLLSEKVNALNIPVVLVSNYPQLKFSELQHKLKVQAHLLKPVSFTMLENCVKTYMSENAVNGYEDQAIHKTPLHKIQ